MKKTFLTETEKQNDKFLKKQIEIDNKIMKCHEHLLETINCNGDYKTLQDKERETKRIMSFIKRKFKWVR